MKTIIVIAASILFTSNAFAERGCGGWAKQTPQSIVKTVTISELAEMKSELQNCSGIRAEDLRESNPKKAEALDCYSNLSGSLGFTEETLDDEMLRAEETLKETKCAPSGDRELDHLYTILKASVGKFAAQRRPIAQQEQKLAAQQAAADEKEKALQEAKKNSRECQAAIAKKEFCGAMTIARIDERTIEHENEVGRQSGYVNANKIRNATSSKIKMAQDAEVARKKYKAAMGTDINRSVCGITDVGYTSAKLPYKLDEDMNKACGD